MDLPVRGSLVYRKGQLALELLKTGDGVPKAVRVLVAERDEATGLDRIRVPFVAGEPERTILINPVAPPAKSSSTGNDEPAPVTPKHTGTDITPVESITVTTTPVDDHKGLQDFIYWRPDADGTGVEPVYVVLSNLGGNAGKGTTYPEGINFNINQKNHLATFDGFSQKKGISGTHNLDEFNQAASANGVKILNETPGPVNGITHIEYQIPAKDRAGNITGYKAETFEKTVYDPKIFSDQKMLDLGQQAATSGYKAAIVSGAREYTATAGGVKFQVFLDQKTGTVTNFFPVTK
ncbi:hypothetical protein PEC301877_43220 [Pectobacterium carotovorum subsp. carotovorum]|nr:hypothetical protein PEC301877_43220 [Pectobacterium carotovorum subsp. carotovorum]